MITFTQTPQTFFVEEVLAYEPSGAGEHVFAKIRKSGLSTFALKRKLSERLGIPLRELAHAGKKDAAATSVQWLSWPVKSQKAPLAERQFEDYEILVLTLHAHSLSPGHIRSNCFELELGSQDPANPLEEAIQNVVFPNFFGTQRFGSAVPEWHPNMKPAKGPKPTKDRISVVQAALFNGYLQKRLRTWGKDVQEDEYWMHAGGKRFFQAPLDEELQRRYHGGEIFPSGPVFGYKTPLNPDEKRFLEELGLEADTFRVWGKGAKGARRPLFARAEGLVVEPADGGLRLRFELPSGSYATVFLLHLLAPAYLLQPLSSWPNFTNITRWERSSDGHRLELV